MAIYIHDEAVRLRLRVTGHLDEQAARELKSCWTTAASVVGSRKIVLDLSGLSSFQEFGRKILEILYRDGAEFLAESALQLQLVADITGMSVTQSIPDRRTGRWFKGSAQQHPVL